MRQSWPRHQPRRCPSSRSRGRSTRWSRCPARRATRTARCSWPPSPAATSEITEALASDDTRYMHRALEALGVRVRADEAARTFVVEGVDGHFPATEATLQIGKRGHRGALPDRGGRARAGTFVVDGSPAMRKRPIEPLLDGLRALGVDAVSREGTGCPPVVVRAAGIAGGRARMRGGHLEPSTSARSCSSRPTRSETSRSRWRAISSRRPTSR